MTSYKVHGSPFSMATLRVLATLEEEELDYEFIHVNMATEQQKEESYISSFNPFGQVPAFEDGDIKLFESRAITDYIVFRPQPSQVGIQISPLRPFHDRDMAMFEMWLEVEAHQFDPSASTLAFELGFKAMMEANADEPVVAECVAKLEKVLDIYEGWLDKSQYLGGDKFSLVDVHHQPTIHFMMGEKRVKHLLESRPLVKDWSEDILDRPAWAKVVEMQKKYK